MLPSWTFGHQAWRPSPIPKWYARVWTRLRGNPLLFLFCILQFGIEWILTTGYWSWQLWLVWLEQSKAVLSRVIESRIGLRGVFGERKRMDGKCHNIVLTMAPIRYWMSWEDHSPVRYLSTVWLSEQDQRGRFVRQGFHDRKMSWWSLDKTRRLESGSSRELPHVALLPWHKCQVVGC